MIEVQADDLLLGVAPLQLHRYDPLDRLLQCSLHNIVCMRGVELLSELLGDRTTTAGVLVAHDDGAEESSQYAHHIDATVVGKSLVLRGDQRVNERGSEVVVVRMDAIIVLQGKCPQYLTILADHL